MNPGTTALCSRLASQNRGSCFCVNMKKELCIRAFRSACQAQGAYEMHISATLEHQNGNT
ncbi:hypothetical protein OBV_34420 [Oscillibacter valericigenes Sjm18-20]|nr:hypothetical protein OBV_34420 [Oscillibacter valericigenes Sjm18-20]